MMGVKSKKCYSIVLYKIVNQVFCLNTIFMFNY